MAIITERGCRVKNLYGASGKKISYYQINATFYSALGESDNKLLLARAIQLFMPGIPQVWYLDLFAGKNDYEAADKAGSGGHKEINRTNLSMNDIENKLKSDIVSNQIELIKFRNTNQAFHGKLNIDEVAGEDHILKMTWIHNKDKASLSANLKDYRFSIEYTESDLLKTIAF